MRSSVGLAVESDGIERESERAKINLAAPKPILCFLQEEVGGAEAAAGPAQPEPRARQHGGRQPAPVRRVLPLPQGGQAESQSRGEVLSLVTNKLICIPSPWPRRVTILSLPRIELGSLLTVRDAHDRA